MEQKQVYWNTSLGKQIEAVEIKRTEKRVRIALLAPFPQMVRYSQVRPENITLRTDHADIDDMIKEVESQPYRITGFFL